MRLGLPGNEHTSSPVHSPVHGRVQGPRLIFYLYSPVHIGTFPHANIDFMVIEL